MAPFRPIARVVQMYKCWHLPRERIDEQGDDDDGDDYTRQIDRRYFIDLRFRRTFQGLVATVPKDAEICAAVLDLVRIGRAVLAATAELSPAEHFEKKKNWRHPKNSQDYFLSRVFFFSIYAIIFLLLSYFQKFVFL